METIWGELDLDLFDLLPIGIGLIDRDGKLVYVNNAGAEMYGYEREELMELSLYDLVENDEEEELQRRVLQYCWEHRTGKRFLTRRRTRTNEIIDVDIQGKFVELKGEHFILHCVREITEQQEVLRTYERAIDIMSKVVKGLSEEK
ncbi:MAG: PAS domain S-box protein [Bacillota bacterium]